MTESLKLNKSDLLLIEKTSAYVKKTLEEAEGGHDWFHTLRVYKNALNIAKGETEADVVVVSLGALLHDIADSKFSYLSTSSSYLSFGTPSDLSEGPLVSKPSQRRIRTILPESTPYSLLNEFALSPS